ncbi:TetR/AcrR family transcriptional regulator [Ruegeria sp. 2205SS24-7]|uniref:TetR/AcrR family transcriptional regulator n=1 Tax=Ruegeria discodermiae TaxID=3064389 RepID=UPI0027429451|nr:TetR/AcrR family transcriptional regulator [Ruegeria sp. 2205SS24-7]MDP5220976.1 TetR/AcrR family transcriptional regulator [Ruegeria sp. 2205SS24-7]
MPKIVDREKMRRTVLRGARDAFIEKGFHAATMADVARAAGLGKGTPYLYFKNKEAIFEAAVTHYFEALEQRFSSAELPTSRAEFVTNLAQTVDTSDDHARFVRVFFEIFGPSFSSDAFAAKIADLFDRLGGSYAVQLRHLQELGEVRADLHAEDTGRVLASIMDGLAIHRGLFSIPDERNKALMQAALTTITNGLKP